MSKARAAGRASPVTAACSRKIAAGPLQSRRVPSRAATCTMAHQSGRASPGQGRKARWRLMTRSLLVTVPDFSPQASAGRRTWAKAAVSDRRVTSDVTRKGARASAARTASPSGSDIAGLVAMIHSALMSPAASAAKSCVALRPGARGSAGAFQKAASAACSAGTSKRRWPASIVASAPVSRPPIAFGWPVTLKGPAPGRPIRPVSRWQLMIALALSVPALDWFTPWLQSVTVRGLAAQAPQKRATSAGSSPVSSAARGAMARAAANASTAPSACASSHARSARPWSSRCASSPANSATSLPGSSGRCRSAPAQVAVRRGSTTMTCIEGRAAFAAVTRWNSTGWHQARLLPTSTMVSASSRSA
ncbi:hypothetical protein ROS9278_02454 [Roseomonas sp. CECT 9278]|nr:hypothetical protein ROS9278_02454 [Roseomonas sp. CECT 9278]